jgi:hypothetical protein
MQGVIAHEYFHNWTGNRVTCRDWFQLSLKVRCCSLEPVESHVESAWLQRLTLAGFNFVFLL